MLYFQKQNLVYLAIPKTGTTAIEAALSDQAQMRATNPPGLKHVNVPEYRKHLEPLLKRHSGGGTPQIFVVLRDPLARILSWYRYRQRNGPIAKTDRSTKGLSAEAFLEEVMSDKPRPFAQYVGDQARFCGLEKGQPAPELMFPYEHPEPLAAFLRDQFGVAQTKRVNVSPGHSIAVSAEVQARLRQHRAAEYALYDSVLRRHGVAP